MGLFKRFKDKLDSFLTSVARHGKSECPECGSFNKIGHGCRCYDRKDKWSDRLSTEDIQALLKRAYERTTKDGKHS